jgi:hypothetical protein
MDCDPSVYASCVAVMTGTCYIPMLLLFVGGGEEGEGVRVGGWS